MSRPRRSRQRRSDVPIELLAAVTDRALHVSGAGQEPDHRQRRDALAAPRLPGDPDDPAGKERQGQPLHRPRPLAAGEVHLEVGDLEDGSRRPRLGEAGAGFFRG